MRIFVIENDDVPSCTHILGVADSVAAAAALVKSPYCAPYIVEWDDPVEDKRDGRWSITGHFTGVRDYCGDGPKTWLFTPYEVSTSVCQRV